MTEREIKQLNKLLRKFQQEKRPDDPTQDYMSPEGREIVGNVIRWVKWLADERSIDL
jgi:hypothetical protein